jgi:hypothetical protein
VLPSSRVQITVDRSKLEHSLGTEKSSAVLSGVEAVGQQLNQLDSEIALVDRNTAQAWRSHILGTSGKLKEALDRGDFASFATQLAEFEAGLKQLQAYLQYERSQGLIAVHAESGVRLYRKDDTIWLVTPDTAAFEDFRTGPRAQELRDFVAGVTGVEIDPAAAHYQSAGQSNGRKLLGCRIDALRLAASGEHTLRTTLRSDDQLQQQTISFDHSQLSEDIVVDASRGYGHGNGWPQIAFAVTEGSSTAAAPETAAQNRTDPPPALPLSPAAFQVSAVTDPLIRPVARFTNGLSRSFLDSVRRATSRPAADSGTDASETAETAGEAPLGSEPGAAVEPLQRSVGNFRMTVNGSTVINGEVISSGSQLRFVGPDGQAIESLENLLAGENTGAAIELKINFAEGIGDGLRSAVAAGEIAVDAEGMRYVRWSQAADPAGSAEVAPETSFVSATVEGTEGRFGAAAEPPVLEAETTMRPASGQPAGAPVSEAMGTEVLRSPSGTALGTNGTTTNGSIPSSEVATVGSVNGTPSNGPANAIVPNGQVPGSATAPPELTTAGGNGALPPNSGANGNTVTVNTGSATSGTTTTSGMTASGPTTGVSASPTTARPARFAWVESFRTRATGLANNPAVQNTAYLAGLVGLHKALVGDYSEEAKHSATPSLIRRFFQDSLSDDYNPGIATSLRTRDTGVIGGWAMDTTSTVGDVGMLYGGLKGGDLLLNSSRAGLIRTTAAGRLLAGTPGTILKFGGRGLAIAYAPIAGYGYTANGEFIHKDSAWDDTKLAGAPIEGAIAGALVGGPFAPITAAGGAVISTGTAVYGTFTALGNVIEQNKMSAEEHGVRLTLERAEQGGLKGSGEPDNRITEPAKRYIDRLAKSDFIRRAMEWNRQNGGDLPFYSDNWAENWENVEDVLTQVRDHRAGRSYWFGSPLSRFSETERQALSEIYQYVFEDPKGTQHAATQAYQRAYLIESRDTSTVGAWGQFWGSDKDESGRIMQVDQFRRLGDDFAAQFGSREEALKTLPDSDAKQEKRRQLLSDELQFLQQRFPDIARFIAFRDPWNTPTHLNELESTTEPRGPDGRANGPSVIVHSLAIGEMQQQMQRGEEMAQFYADLENALQDPKFQKRVLESLPEEPAAAGQAGPRERMRLYFAGTGDLSDTELNKYLSMSFEAIDRGLLSLSAPRN